MISIGTGDGGFATKPGNEFGLDPFNSAQRPDALLGKIPRIDTDSGVTTYAIPASNPIGEGARPEIWATGDLLTGDAGHSHRDEIDCQPRGRNYGWSVREGAGGAPESDCPDIPNLSPPLRDYALEEGCPLAGGGVHRGA